MIRYYVLQYRDDLLALRAKEVESSFRIEPVVEPWRPPFTSRVAREAMSQPENEKDSVASDMLAVLRAIPLEVIGEINLNGANSSRQRDKPGCKGTLRRVNLAG